MKNLTRIFFCIFAVAFFYSCEPEEIFQEEESKKIIFDKIDPIGDTGNENDVRPTKE
jgi:hypothetical protein